MSYEIIPVLLIILSLTGIAFIIGRHISQLARLPIQNSGQRVDIKQGLIRLAKGFVVIIKSISYRNLLRFFAGTLEKFLRRLRIQILKIDNRFFLWIQKLRVVSGKSFLSEKYWMRSISDVKKEVKKVIEKKDKLSQDLVRSLKKRITERRILAAIAKKPKDPEGYRKLANFYLNEKNYHDAKEALYQILKIKPNDSEAKARLEEIEKMPM